MRDGTPISFTLRGANRRTIYTRILQPSSRASRVAQPVRRVFHDEKKIKISKRNAHSQVQHVTAKCKLQLLYSWSFATLKKIFRAPADRKIARSVMGNCKFSYFRPTFGPT